MDFTKRIVCIPTFQFLFLSGAVIQAAEEKPGVFITVRQSGYIDASSVSIIMGADVYFSV